MLKTRHSIINDDAQQENYVIWKKRLYLLTVHMDITGFTVMTSLSIRNTSKT